MAKKLDEVYNNFTLMYSVHFWRTRLAKKKQTTKKNLVENIIKQIWSNQQLWTSKMRFRNIYKNAIDLKYNKIKLVYSKVLCSF